MDTLDSSLYLSNDDLHLLGNGNWYRSHEKLGAHPAVAEDGTKGYHFAVWAPHVQSVAVVGDFNDWNETAFYLNPASSGDVWEGFVPGVKAGQLYKYLLVSHSGEKIYKADPYAFFSELPPGTASITCDLAGYAWKDASYMAERAERPMLKSPLNIFEVHLGSWKRHGDEPQGEPREDGTWPGPGDPFPAQRGTHYTYDDLSKELVAYAKKMGYSHIEVMPLSEHPFDGSWGYQSTGYFAPTSRYGNPKQLMHFIDACHKAGIGVIMDWVPGGFCADSHGLAKFNGEMLYEHEIHPNWGTHKFDFSRGQVRSFLVSNALYWVETYHIDGIRMDGVSSMLYMNFGIDDPGQKRFNKYGTEEALDASAFIRQTNSAMGQLHPDVMMIAEESTAWPLVTYPPSDGGLGFHFKWDMGWMNDTLHYMQTDFPWRPGNHRMLTFSSMYQFNENFILPLSHDEVVNGKCSLITRMPGDQWRQFAGLRALAFYQMTHPGGKLNFMGNEIGQYIEWRYYEGIEYFLTEYDTHRNEQVFIEALNKFYKKNPALWQRGYESSGFEWLDADNSDQSIISFIRRGDDPKDDLVILINFDINPREDFRLGVPEWGVYAEKFNSDAAEYGGSGVVNEGRLRCEEVGWNGRAQSVVVRIPPLGGIVLQKVATQARPKAKGAAAVKHKVTAKKAAAKAEKPATTTTKAAKTAAKATPVAEKTSAAAKSEPAAAQKANTPASAKKAPAKPAAPETKPAAAKEPAKAKAAAAAKPAKKSATVKKTVKASAKTK
ncbi:1,4-alpha-glucan branching protein GlgB [Paratractidigestivibacter sp.]|uniref:1,4-alpha-glucan branching protein GlgB n=1 Tax=Paratractidigestivibacter sp. TaxID=2847316 RepID=UPI002AC9C9F8|nr:1,4-alpha-glucan branching protein GlgB [Paratractidigestivibacter sp.]